MRKESGVLSAPRAQKGPMDILAQTLRKEGFFALYKGASDRPSTPCAITLHACWPAGMASPLVGIAGVNSLLFAAYAASKRAISPFPQLSLKEIAAAGAMAGAVNAILASPGTLYRFDDYARGRLMGLHS